MTSTPAARAFIIFSGAIVATGVLVVVLLFTTRGNTAKTAEKVEQNTDILQDQEAILRIILAVTGCTVEDTHEQCRDKVRQRSLIEGQVRVDEVDCRIRRALSGAPPPAKDQACIPPPPPTTTTSTTAPPPPPPPG